MADDPDRIIKKEVKVQVLHNAAVGWWRGKPTIADFIGNGKQQERQVG